MTAVGSARQNAKDQRFTRSIVPTPRLKINVWTSGPEDGLPLLLVHGNVASGAFWKYVAAELPEDIRVLAPDLRGFGRTEGKPVDATRGLGDFSDDVHGLLEALGLGGQPVNAAGWSMGAGVLMQQLIEHPGDLASMVLVAPMSPFGQGGTTDAKGTLAFRDAAGGGAGTVNADFIRRMMMKDDTEMMPFTSPRVVFRTYFGPQGNAANVDEDFLVEELLRTRIGDTNYPGNIAPSLNWPFFAPGDRGVYNAFSSKYFDASGIVDVANKPPVTWIYGQKDQMVSNRSMFDLGTLGSMGVAQGWPGPSVFQPQPMEDQLRFVLKEYAERGGRTREVPLEGVGHGIPLEVPGRLAEEIVASLVR